MATFRQPAIGLITLLFVAIIIGSFAPHGIPDPDQDQGCFCHNGGVGVWANGTDIGLFFEINVDSGNSFVLNITSKQIAVQVSPAFMTWSPNDADNAKFGFNPQQVNDNSPQDQNPNQGTITALFKITAPKDPGSYVITILAQGSLFPFTVLVKQGVPVLGHFAAITKVKSPMQAKAGASVGINVTLQNMGAKPLTLYIYATSTNSTLFDKVYSKSPVSGNGTVALSGVFVMPNGNLTLRIHSGHVGDDGDVDDAAYTVSITQPRPIAVGVGGPIYFAYGQWGPWMPALMILLAAAVGAALGAGTVVRRKGKETRAELKKPADR